jgi:hypothetical protein
MKLFKDEEIKWFYVIEIGIFSFVFLLAVVQQMWFISAGFLLIILGFLYLSWPLSAEITAKNYIIFKYPIRKVEITPTSLFSVKAGGVHDYRAHIILRNRGGLPVGYRCRKYENAPILAQALLDLIEKTPNAKVTDDALKLLKQVAKGNRKPLPLK